MGIESSSGCASVVVPVVFVHGTGGSGADMQTYVRRHIGEEALRNGRLVCPSFQTPYQFLLPHADDDLIIMLDDLYQAGVCTRRAVIVGHSGGAQFAHRFALKHPHLVDCAIVLAAGCYTNQHGVSYGMMVEEQWFTDSPWDDPAVVSALENTASPGFEQVAWVVGCGTADKDSRIESSKRFFADIETPDSEYFSFTADHRLPEGEEAEALAEILRERIEAASR